MISLADIDRKLSLILKGLDELRNPSLVLSAKEKGQALGEAIRSGDKARIKRVKGQINGGK